MIVDEHLARRLVDDQFPQWAHLRLRPVTAQGWDNRMFRPGDALSVRLPSAACYAAQVDKEQRWLPLLAPHLPRPVPVPVARGVPGLGYPHPWSVPRRIPGEPAAPGSIRDDTAFAFDLAAFLVALRHIHSANGPVPGAHNFFRGGPLTVYAEETRHAIDALGTARRGSRLRHGHRVDATVRREPRRVPDGARPRRRDLGARRGWALWKALITLAGQPTDAFAWRTLDAVLADHERES